MNLKTSLCLALMPACFLVGPERGLRYRPLQRARREEFELMTSAWAGDIEPSRHDDKFAVELRLMPRERVIEECRRLGVWGRMPGPRDPVGCNLVYLDREPKLCVILAEEPRYVDDQRTTVLGHELLHCARGRYHP